MIIWEKLNWLILKCCFSLFCLSFPSTLRKQQWNHAGWYTTYFFIVTDKSVTLPLWRQKDTKKQNKTQCVNCMYSPSSSHRPSCSFTIKHIHSLQAGFSLEFSSQKISSANRDGAASPSLSAKRKKWDVVTFLFSFKINWRYNGSKLK